MNSKREKPKILINSVPKSGTNLLIQIVKGIPDIIQNNSIFNKSRSYFEILNLKPGEMVSRHVPYNKEFSQQFKAHSIKQICIYRDLRDVAVSLVYFINDKFHDHPLYPVFQKRLITFEAQMNAVICGVEFEGDEINNKWGIKNYPGIYHEFQPIYRWIEDPSICSIRFENLVSNGISRDQEILKIIDFLWDNLDYLELEKDELLSVMKENIDPSKSWTYRKGNIGNWKSEFSLENKKNFKGFAGEILIKYGYEKDFDW